MELIPKMQESVGISLLLHTRISQGSEKSLQDGRGYGNTALRPVWRNIIKGYALLSGGVFVL